MKANTPHLRTKILHKAKQQYLNSALAKLTKGHKKIYIEIVDIESQKTHIVTLEQTPQGLIASCTCTLKSLHIDKPTFCSHIITGIMETMRRATKK